MNPVQVAKIQADAAKKERLEIAQAIRLMAEMGRVQARRDGKSAAGCEILDKLADMIEERKL